MASKFSNLSRRALVLGMSALSLAASASLVKAQTYPNQPVRVIVPLAAASTVDIMARKVGEQLSAKMGQQFVIDNRPGAGGVIGTAEMIRAPKDGYTIGMISSNHVINPNIMKSVPYDTLKDITPITILGTVPVVLVTHPSIPAKTVQELVALAKEKPGELDFGSAGNGSVLHLAGVLFNREAGVNIKHIPYKGTGPLTNDLVAGHVKIGFLSTAAALPQIQSGALRALGVTTQARVETLPDVPTLAESGLKNYSLDSWIAIIGPPGLPKPVVDRLYAESKEVVNSPKMKADLAAIGVTAVGSDPATTEKFLATELEKHTQLVAISGTKPE